MRLDESRLEELRQWGQALRDGGSQESAAAGRAVLLLLDEVERLRLELRLVGSPPEPEDPVFDDEAEAGASEPVSSPLHQRLQRVLGRDVELEPDSSARSWIETLRRQK